MTYLVQNFEIFPLTWALSRFVLCVSRCGQWGLTGTFDSLSSLPFFDIRTHAVILFHFQVWLGFDLRQKWREVEGGALPLTTRGLRATSVGKTLYVTGGFRPYGDPQYEDWILSWDPIEEKWQEAGHLLTERMRHAAVPLPSSVINSYCKEKKWVCHAKQIHLPPWLSFVFSIETIDKVPIEILQPSPDHSRTVPSRKV